MVAPTQWLNLSPFVYCCDTLPSSNYDWHCPSGGAAHDVPEDSTTATVPLDLPKEVHHAQGSFTRTLTHLSLPVPPTAALPKASLYLPFCNNKHVYVVGFCGQAAYA